MKQSGYCKYCRIFTDWKDDCCSLCEKYPLCWCGHTHRKHDFDMCIECYLENPKIIKCMHSFHPTKKFNEVFTKRL